MNLNLIIGTTGLIEELFSSTTRDNRCPFVDKDDVGPYCAKNLPKGAIITEPRRSICDLYSLQIWCLHKNFCDRCVYYQGKPID